MEVLVEEEELPVEVASEEAVVEALVEAEVFINNYHSCLFTSVF